MSFSVYDILTMQLNNSSLGYRRQHQLELEVQELKQRVMGLQHDLDLSEQTQRDFVRLSQSLQVQLEKIRQSDSEVSRHKSDYFAQGLGFFYFRAFITLDHCMCSRLE